MKKKIVCTAIVLGMVMMFSGCGSEEKSQETTKQEVSKTEEKTTAAEEKTDKEEETKDLSSYPETPAEELWYEEVEGGIEIKGFRSGSKDYEVLVIPAQIDGKDVVSIGTDAFKYDKVLTGVVVGENVKRIRARAFSGTSALKEVVIRGDVEEIGGEAFESTYALEKIELPETLKRIKQKAFFSSGISSICIPASVENIELWAFASGDLESMEFEEGCKAVLEDGAIYGCRDLKNVKIPESLTEISGNFQECGDVVIDTPSGSAAEAYAKANNIKLK